MDKLVAIVVVTYNRLEMLKDLVCSLREQTYKNYKIIIVNNSSTDGTEDYLSIQEDLIVIKQENCGGAGGFFTGIREAVKRGFDYIWVMDDDVLCDKNALNNLMNKTEYSKGFLCSNVRDLNNNPCNVPAISMNKLSSGELDWPIACDKNMIKIVRTSFVCALIPSCIVKEIGLPYREFFIWFDDAEYTTRISDKYDSFMVLDSVVTHRRIQNSILSIFTEKNKRRIKMFYYFYRNSLFVSRKQGFKAYAYRILRVLFDQIKCLVTFQFYKYYIITKAVFASLFFDPKIQYI